MCFYVWFLATVRSGHPPPWVTCRNFHALFLTTLRRPRKVVNTVSCQRGELARMTLTPMLPGSANQYVNPGSCGVLTKGLCFNTSLHRTFFWFFRRSIPLSSLCIYLDGPPQTSRSCKYYSLWFLDLHVIVTCECVLSNCDCCHRGLANMLSPYIRRIFIQRMVYRSDLLTNIGT